METKGWAMRFICLIAFLATVPAANWMIGHVGTECHGPVCLIPVWPGIMAPSGVLMIGAALVLRDVIHKQLGAKWTLGSIIVGASISALISPAIAIASGVAFLLSELADMAVYAPLYERHKISAVLLSGVAGSIVDSLLFLWIAFGSIQFIEGQIIGKLMMSCAAALVLWIIQTYKNRTISYGL